MGTRHATRTSIKKRPDIVPASTWNAIKRLMNKHEMQQVDDALGGYVLTEAGKTRLFSLGLRT